MQAQNSPSSLETTLALGLTEREFKRMEEIHVRTPNRTEQNSFSSLNQISAIL